MILCIRDSRRITTGGVSSTEPEQGVKVVVMVLKGYMILCIRDSRRIATGGVASTEPAQGVKVVVMVLKGFIGTVGINGLYDIVYKAWSSCWR